MISKSHGRVYWITGLSGAGKTTVGNALYYKIKEKHENVLILDGDILKFVVSGDTVAYNEEDRMTRAYRYSRMCQMLSNQGMIVIICTIAMFDEVRKWNRDNIENYIEVFLDVSLEILTERDQKGLYSGFINGKVHNLVGFDINVQFPKYPDLRIENNGKKSVKEVVREILNYKVKNLDDFERDTEYWNNIYTQNKIEIEPSLFAQSIIKYLDANKKILDLGCGNGRDSLFFSNKGLNVVGIDASSCTIKNLKNNFENISNILFVCGDFVTSENLYECKYDYVYSRFTIHAINEKQQEQLLKNVYRCLNFTGKFFIEVRSINDDLYGKGQKIARNTYLYNDHFRRFIVKEELISELNEQGFDIEYQEEGKGLSPYKDQDPVLIRIVAVKKQLGGTADELGR